MNGIEAPSARVSGLKRIIFLRKPRVSKQPAAGRRDPTAAGKSALRPHSKQIRIKNTLSTT
jgi:hypothetical protein